MENSNEELGAKEGKSIINTVKKLQKQSNHVLFVDVSKINIFQSLENNHVES